MADWLRRITFRSSRHRATRFAHVARQICTQAEHLEDRLLLTATPNGDNLRTYRLAVAATEEYTAFFGDDRTAAQNAISATIANINQILNRELNVQLDLIIAPDIIFGGDNPSSDPFSGSPSAVLDQNQTLLDTTIGSENYEIGHVFGTFAEGGLATLNSVGMNGIKAQGASGTSSPTGTGFELLAIHEIGHQFGATHTFNGSDPARNAATAWEPGSGSTIGAYAGLLSDSENVQDDSDDYFQAGNIDQIVSHLTTLDGAGVGTITSNVNQIPTVNGGSDFTIPADTPFMLTATGSNADGDSLLYTFEQMDLGAAQPLSAPDNGSSPLFRSFAPAAANESGEFTRVFPQISDILSGTSTKGETLPSTTRSLNFRATVRDQQGGTDGDDVLVSVVDTGSAFAVTTLNSSTTITGGASYAMTWDVAGTTANGINVSQVEILLSTDGGQSFPYSLGATANDGSQSIAIPNIDTSTARFLIRAVDNIFFDITDADVTISADSGAPGATVTESGGGTSVGEVVAVGAASDTYTLALNTTPAAAVDVTIDADNDILVSSDGTNFFSSLTLSLSDTSASTIYVRAFNDADVEGIHTGTLTQTVSSTGDPSYPVGLLMNSVIVTVIDDERTPLIGVDLQSSGGTVPTNWTEINQNDNVFSATTFSNLIREDGGSTTIDLTIGPPTSQGITFGPSDPESSTIPVHIPSLADVNGVLGWTKETANTVNVNWSGLTAGDRYNVYVMAQERFDKNASMEDINVNHVVSIFGSGVDDPVPFMQTTTGFAGELQINNQQGSSSQTLEDFALTVTADLSGEIDIQIVRNDGVADNVVYLSAVAIQHAVTPTSEAPGPSISFNTDTGQFSVTVSGNEDVVISSTNGPTGSVTVAINGVDYTSFGSVAPQDVQSIVVTGGTGPNLLDLADISSTAFTNAGGVAVTATGGDGNDTIAGSEFPDSIDGGAGDDAILGYRGADTLSGGADNDLMDGGLDGDSMDGGTGNDAIAGRFGNDTIDGGDGLDSMSGGRGFDSIRGGAGNDLIVGNVGRDTLIGESGDDTIFGGVGKDSISGGEGADVLRGQGGADGINAGNGADDVRGAAGVDTLLGLAGNDTLHGGLRGDILIGGDDNDDLTGAGGTDTLAGSSGTDAFDDNGEVDEGITEAMFAALLALA